MLDTFLLEKFDLYFYNILGDVFIILMAYSFIKLLLLSSLVELIWPTQFFNRRNSSGSITYRLRNYVEVFTKIRITQITSTSVLLLLNFK